MIQQWLGLAPEIFVLTASCLLLLIGLFQPRLVFSCALLIPVIAAFLTVYSYQTALPVNPLLAGQFIADHLGLILDLFIYLNVLFVFIYSRQYNNARFMPVPEFYVLALLAMLGMMILVSANHLLILFLGIELFSLASYAMVALVRNDARCIEAGMKYFLLGAVATAILLYGISLIFGVTHGLNFDAIRQAIPAGTATPLLLTLGMIFVLAGVAFKLGIAPFHLWVPDVYEGAPTSVTLFISTAPKLAAFAALIRIVSEMLPTLATTWQPILIALAVVSMAIGNIGAIVQSNLKRLLAYSSIAHMGYLLLGLISGTARGYAAAMFYMISYSVMTLAAFGMLILLSRAGLEVENIRDLNGLNQRHPWLAFMMLITTFSLAGVPPLVGFIAKVGVLEALLQVHLIWLAVVAILFSVIGAYYYLRIVKVMYFEDTIAEVTMPKIRPDLMTAMTINGVGILLLGVFPGWLFGLTHFAFFGI